MRVRRLPLRRTPGRDGQPFREQLRLRALGQGRSLAVAALIVGLLLSVMAVWGRSVAAFSGSTPGNAGSWGLATVALTDDDNEYALIDVSAIGGESGTACIAVTFEGTIPAQVRMYTAEASDPGDLGERVGFWIEEGTGGTSSGCESFVPTRMLFSGTLASLIAQVDSYASGLGTWSAAPGGDTTRTYRFTWALDPTSDETLVDESVSATVVWESRQV